MKNVASQFVEATLLAELDLQGQTYLEFLRSDALSAGLYRLRAGETDLQQPHSEDEVYYVLEGLATLEISGKRFAARPGSIIYVPAFVTHRFADISQDLLVLVFFAPAEGTDAIDTIEPETSSREPAVGGN